MQVGTCCSELLKKRLLFCFKKDTLDAYYFTLKKDISNSIIPLLVKIEKISNNS